jgi:hypothetical protein
MPEARTATEVMDMLRRRGFAADFSAHADGLRVSGSEQRLAPDDVVIREFHRFEGESDPDDMSILYAIEAGDGTRGVLMDAFGVYASPAVGAVLALVRFGPSRSGGPVPTPPA